MSEENQRVILRFVDGKMLKGFIRDLKIAEEYLYLEDESNHQHKVRLKELKAIFFVRKFEGERNHLEKKSFTGTRPGSSSSSRTAKPSWATWKAISPGRKGSFSSR